MEFMHNLLSCTKCQVVFQYYDYYIHINQCIENSDNTPDNTPDNTTTSNIDITLQYDNDLYNSMINRGFYNMINNMFDNTSDYENDNTTMGLGSKKLLKYGTIYSILENTKCIICYNIYSPDSLDEKDNKFYKTKCCHSFCISCSEKWFDTNSLCPLCKTNLKNI